MYRLARQQIDTFLYENEWEQSELSVILENFTYE